MQNNKNKETLDILLPLGKLLRSSQVTFSLNGIDSHAVQTLITSLEELVNSLALETCVVVDAPQLPTTTPTNE